LRRDDKLVCGKTGTSSSTTLADHPLEVSGLEQTGRSRETGQSFDGLRRQLPCLRCQSGAAFGATTCNYCATTDSCHAGTKTMSALAADDAGLIGAFHDVLLGQKKKGAEFTDYMVLTTRSEFRCGLPRPCG
tara:strand:- start:6991 stop:7386 length:396 start_codon:yes stop_codon:yes gene_type:complete